MDDFNIQLPSYLHKDSTPHTIIEINLGKHWIPLDCLIDTGFNGFILLPTTYQHHFSVSLYEGKREYIIGDGSNINLSMYRGQWRVEEFVVNTEILFTSTKIPIVGTQFLKQFQLYINFKKHKIKLYCYNDQKFY